MGSELVDLIRSLDNKRAIVAIRALIAFLDVSLHGSPQISDTARVDTTNLAELIRSSPESVALRTALQQSVVSVETVADVARGLLLVVLELGYTTEVDQACEPVLLYALGPGRYSGADTVGALTAILIRLPQSKKQELRRLVLLTEDTIRLGSESDHIVMPKSDPIMTRAIDRWLDTVTSDVTP